MASCGCGTRMTGQAVGAPLPADTGPVGGVDGVALQPGRQAAGHRRRDGTVRLWNPAAHRAVGAPLLASTSPGGSVNGVAFSPDGKLLATADTAGYIRLWNPATQPAVGAPSPRYRQRRRNRGSVQPRRQAPGHRRHRRHRTVVESGQSARPSASPSRLSLPAAWTRWRSARTASCWPAPTRPDSSAAGTRPPAAPSALRFLRCHHGRRQRGGVQPGRQAPGRRRRRRHPAAVECGDPASSPRSPSPAMHSAA